MMHWRWYQFEELTLQELYDLLTLRQEVFVVEQDCPYLDADSADQQSWHLLGWAKRQHNDVQSLAAYLRVIPPGVKYKEAAIGRVAIKGVMRRQGLGKKLMEEGIRKIEKEYSSIGIRISAQKHLEKFYQVLGFIVVSEPYDEDGIPHIEMLRRSTIFVK